MIAPNSLLDANCLPDTIAPMKLRLENQLRMVGACLDVAYRSEYQPTWNGKPPLDFGVEMLQLKNAYLAVTAKAVQADAATGSVAEAKALAESSLEDATFVLTRALALHFRRTGDLSRHGTVDMTRTEIGDLRAQELVNRASAIRDFGSAASGEPGAEGRGVTPARVLELTAAIDRFSGLMNAPRSQIVNRGTILKDLESDLAALLNKVADLDDFVVQFEVAEGGWAFVEAWRRARIIVDTAATHRNADSQPAPAPAPGPVPK